MRKWFILNIFVCCHILQYTLAQDHNGIYKYETDEFDFTIVHDTKLGWHKALEACKKLGGSLITLDSQTKLIGLQEFLISHRFIPTAVNSIDPPFIYWTSGNDLEQPGTFVWKGNGEKFEYTHWLHRKPEPIAGGGCVQIGDKAVGCWSIRACDKHLYYICENTKAYPTDQNSQLPPSKQKPIDEKSQLSSSKQTPIDEKSQLPSSKQTPIDEKSQLPSSKQTPIDQNFELPSSKQTPIDQNSELPSSKQTPIDQNSQLPSSKQKHINQNSQLPSSQQYSVNQNSQFRPSQQYPITQVSQFRPSQQYPKEEHSQFRPSQQYPNEQHSQFRPPKPNQNSIWYPSIDYPIQQGWVSPQQYPVQQSAQWTPSKPIHIDRNAPFRPSQLDPLYHNI